jgi:HlyD family secretion protein
VGSEISGLVPAVYAQANDRVVKGQVLARVDTARLEDAITRSRAALAAAQASVAQARATSRQSQANLKRLLEVFRLSGGKVPSQTELDTGRADAARADAGIASAQARAQLNSDQTNLARATIRSPVNGVVLSREVEEGQTIQGSFSTPTLFTIAEDLSAMKLEVKVDEADVGQVAAGQRATFSVDAFPGRRFPATIQRVNVGSSISSAATGSSTSTATTSTNSVVSYTAVLQVANPELILRPGMTATADIVVAEQKVVFLVPNAALRYTPGKTQGKGRRPGGLMTQMGPPMRGRGGAEKTAKIERGARRQIYVVGPDGTPQAVNVTVGSSNGSQTEVSGPDLREGMQVITGSLAAPDA